MIKTVDTYYDRNNAYDIRLISTMGLTDDDIVSINEIGDTIELELEDDDNTVNSNQLKIVGTVISPNYLINGNGSVSRGSTTIGSGKINFYSYTTSDYFNMDYYTEINVNVANDFITDSDEYNSLINEATDKIEKIKKDVFAYLLNSENAEKIKQKLPSNMIGYQFLIEKVV